VVLVDAVAGGGHGAPGLQTDPNGNIWWYDRLYWHGYTTDKNIFVCPSLAPRRFDPSEPIHTYGAIVDDPQYHLEFTLPGDRRFLNLSRLTDAASVAVVLDSSNEMFGAGSWQRCVIWKTSFIATPSGHLRHARRANVAYADGHVAVSDQERLTEAGFNGSWVGFDGPESRVWVPFF